MGGRGARGWEVLLFPTPAFVQGSREPRPGALSPLSPSPSAAGQDWRGAGGPGSPSRRDVAEGRAADAQVEGTLDAAGQRALPTQPFGGCPRARADLWGALPPRRRELLALNSRFAPSSGLGLRARLLGIRVA